MESNTEQLIFKEFFDFLNTDSDLISSIQHAGKFVLLNKDTVITKQPQTIAFKLIDTTLITPDILTKLIDQSIIVYLNILSVDPYIINVSMQYTEIALENHQLIQKNISPVFAEDELLPDYQFKILSYELLRLSSKINTSLILNLLKDIKPFLHIDDLDKLTNFTYTKTNDQNIFIPKFEQDDIVFLSQPKIICDLEIEPHGFIKKISNILIDYQCKFLNVIPNTEILFTNNKNVKINRKLLNFNEKNILFSIQDLLDIQDIIMG